MSAGEAGRHVVGFFDFVIDVFLEGPEYNTLRDNKRLRSTRMTLLKYFGPELGDDALRREGEANILKKMTRYAPQAEGAVFADDALRSHRPMFFAFISPHLFVCLVSDQV